MIFLQSANSNGGRLRFIVLQYIFYRLRRPLKQRHNPIAHDGIDVAPYVYEHRYGEREFQPRADHEREERAEADLQGTHEVATVVPQLACHGTYEREYDCTDHATQHDSDDQARCCSACASVGSAEQTAHICGQKIICHRHGNGQ